MRGLIYLVLMVLCWPAIVAANDWREFTDASGQHKIVAYVAHIEAGKSVELIRRVDSRSVTVPLDKLSERDRAFIRGKAVKFVALTTTADKHKPRPPRCACEVCQCHHQPVVYRHCYQPVRSFFRCRIGWRFHRHRCY